MGGWLTLSLISLNIIEHIHFNGDGNARSKACGRRSRQRIRLLRSSQDTSKNPAIQRGLKGRAGKDLHGNQVTYKIATRKFSNVLVVTRHRQSPENHV